ncbi:MAG: hypothetical protein LDL42_16260 [Rhizobium sp.]|nr:hypothetical protein [Rhizobium sp.]
MTATNVAIFPGSAVVVSDAAYSAGNVLIRRGEKFIAMPHLNAVVTFRGHVGTLDRLRRVLPNSETLDDLLKNGPRMIRRALWWKTVIPYYGAFEIILTGVDSDGRSFIRYLSSRRAPRFEWVAVDHSIFAPMPDMTILADVTAKCGADFDGAMIDMLQHQRQVQSGIGGHATKTVITSEGILTRELCRWPDRRWRSIKREAIPSQASKRQAPTVSAVADYRS